MEDKPLRSDTSGNIESRQGMPTHLGKDGSCSYVRQRYRFALKMTQSKTTQTLFRRQSLAFQQRRLQGDVLIRISPSLMVCWLLLML